VRAICVAWIEAHAISRRNGNKQAALALARLAGEISPHELTPLHFESIVARWKQRLKASTTHCYVQCLRHLVAHIGAISGRPDLAGQVPRVRQGAPRTTITDPPELDQILAHAPRWLQTIILLAAHAGFRRSDCMRIAPIHYNAERRVITIDQQKTGLQVSVPVSDKLAQLLETAPSHSPATPFYALWKGDAITAHGVTSAWCTLKKKAGVTRGLWLHDLRRTLAVSLYEVSKDLRVVEQMLGHNSLGSTVRYLEHKDPQKLRPYLDAIQKPKTEVIQ
jgi:integrase